MTVTQRAAEVVLLFGVLPLSLALAPRYAPELVGPHPPILPTLVLLGALLALALAHDPQFEARRDLAPRLDRAEVGRVLRRFLVAGGLLTLVVLAVRPSGILALPRARPGLFVLVVCGYPLLSVLPQELAFRLWFRHRYAVLFGRERGFVLGSAVAFGWAHVVFWNWPAVVLTALGGVLFAETYRRTGSLWLVAVEHALYGLLVFTLGLGEYFYGGTLQVLGGE